MKYCSNCGKELIPGTSVCLSCGHIVGPLKNQPGKSSALATISVVFGSLGFYPLVLAGSIFGLICSFIVLIYPNHSYKGRAQIGLWISIGSLAFWLLIFTFFLQVLSTFS